MARFINKHFMQNLKLDAFQLVERKDGLKSVHVEYVHFASVRCFLMHGLLLVFRFLRN